MYSLIEADAILRLDIKNVFTRGFLSIRKNLETRFYTTVSSFVVDLSSAISAGLTDDEQTSAANFKTEDESSSKQSTLDEKERKKLARRIIKAIQPQLEAVVHAEADLAKHPAESQLRDLEVLLEATFASRRESIIGSAGNHGEEMDVDMPEQVNSNGIDDDSALQKSITATDAMDIDVDERDAPAEEVDEIAFVSVLSDDSIAPTDLAIQAQIAKQAPSIPTPDGNRSIDTPPDTTDYHSIPEHEQPSPPTPPKSTGDGATAPDLVIPLSAGGIPWYLENFKPVGTSVVEERWTGRDVVRGMSEELSDMDEDELNGLGVTDADIVAADEVEVAEATKKAVKRPKRKRW